MPNYKSQFTGEQIDEAIESVRLKESVWDDVVNKQDTLTAGTNITIDENNVISATGSGSVTWGDIMGNVADQLDLKQELDAKATPADITTAINALNKSASPHTNQYITVVRESAGIIDTQSATLPMHTAGTGISVSSGVVSIDSSVVQSKIADVPADSSNGKFVYSVSQANGQIAVVSKGMDAFATGGTVSDDAYYLHGGSENSPINKLKYLNIWNYIKTKIANWCGLTDNNQPVSTGSAMSYKLKIVGDIPASPEANTIYIVSTSSSPIIDLR